MSLSSKARARLTTAMAKTKEAKEVADAIDAASTVPPGEIPLASAHILVGAASNKAADVALSGDATMANTGAITLGATAVTGKLLTGFVSGAGTVGATDSILQGVNKLDGNVAALQAAGVGGTLTSAHLIVGSVANVATDTAMSGDATISNTGVVTVANSAVIGKVLTGYVSGAGTVAATDTILAGVNKLNGNTAAVTVTANSAYNGSFGIAGANEQTSTVNGEAIDVTKFLTVINSAGAESRTLAAPGGAGQLKVITMNTHGGDVTVALTNVGGHTAATATFGATGQTVVLISTSTALWALLVATAAVA